MPQQYVESAPRKDPMSGKVMPLDTSRYFKVDAEILTTPGMVAVTEVDTDQVKEVISEELFNQLYSTVAE